MRGFLGTSVSNDTEGGSITLGQTKYIEDMAVNYSFNDSRPHTTPLEPDLRLPCDQFLETPCPKDLKFCQTFIGAKVKCIPVQSNTISPTVNTSSS